ncbi:MAG TPA: phosphate signaling complex protein PhoU [Candidatus Thermoplasmatota archaeon]|nr:phosphate signaling complex protein PhoU [Candidatus Thermoplasmatota archaeon]
MVEKFHVELEKLKQNVLKMGDLSTAMLFTAVESLKNLDVEKAEWVNLQKKKLHKMNVDLEEEALQLIALYQPMARDMRTIACCLKMIVDLNRVGRYGKDIANVVKEIAPGSHIKKIISIPHMNELVQGMIADDFTAFRTGDVTKLKGFTERDNDVDSLRYSIFRECVSYMMENPANITICTHYIMVARYLERCGDHACDMAEEIYYMVTGERIELK